jgi:hypothetical protein
MPFLLSAFWPSSMKRTTMPSADFCTLTLQVSLQSAIGIRHEMLSASCFPKAGLVSADSPTDTPGPCLPGWPVPDSLMTILSHGAQISPDKNVNCPCTTAAFTLPSEPVGFVMWC